MYIPTYDDLARRKQQGAGLYLESSRGFIDVCLLGDYVVYKYPFSAAIPYIPVVLGPIVKLDGFTAHTPGSAYPVHMLLRAVPTLAGMCICTK